MNVKLLFSLILALLVLIFTLQNAEAVRIRFFFWEFFLSQALLVFIVFASGMLLGWGLNSLGRSRRERVPPTPSRPEDRS